jgi:3'-phosphoadenosine 5'-phosphosulfate sulfotransferase (PAPS reductase)/FAD synthetase
MIRVIAYSSGKDSTGLFLWAREQFPLSEILVIFDDTIWEHELTYGYISQMSIELFRDVRCEKLVSKEYPGGMEQLVQIKGRVPSPKARFCTEALKVRPTIDFLKTLDDDYELYDGKRAQESHSRAKLPLKEWSDDYDCYVHHPLLYWTTEQVFALAAKYGVQPNPLYLKGAGRVGCFPCVLINQRELKAYLSDPELRDELKRRIYRLESLCGRTFFPPNYIPKRFHTGKDPKSGKTFCWADDVFSYIESVKIDQLPMLEARSCMSIYNLCDR